MAEEFLRVSLAFMNIPYALVSNDPARRMRKPKSHLRIAGFLGSSAEEKYILCRSTTYSAQCVDKHSKRTSPKQRTEPQ